ncbi:hypothetical protein EIP91_005938 [Steccherinum ochraceum]|uniref:Uncharacterized protein n=1 Tax=Steccherinum ochraceum TaxID=92696 RepID=A0A4R0RMM8_9APHY|nr:hypothetical protein EIP91_005938 [Steccherinum ochraceum]
MCKYRQYVLPVSIYRFLGSLEVDDTARVRNVYLGCGHAITEPDVEIKCTDTKCIFSPNHPSTCTGAACKEKCWQHRQFPQQYCMFILRTSKATVPTARAVKRPTQTVADT